MMVPMALEDFVALSALQNLELRIEEKL